MLYDRRRTKRVPVRLEVRWRGDSGTHIGEISDLSIGGCFVLTSGRAMPRELIKLEIAMPFGGLLTAWGLVIEHSPEIGFSLRFTELDELNKTHVEQLIATISAHKETATLQEFITGETTAVKF